MQKQHVIPALLVASSLGVSAVVSAEPVNIVTTINPIALIAKEIAAKQDSVELLLPLSASPHDYALKPSDLDKINQAELLVWVGPELEMFLQKMVAKHANVLTLTDLPGLALRHFDASDNAHAGHQHAHANIDPHIWLGPAQVKSIAAAIAAALSKQAPENTPHYQAALASFNQKLDDKVDELRTAFAEQPAKGYFVFHDAYEYFESAFNLSALGHLTVNPDRKPGAKTLVTIRQQLLQQQAACVFSEPQFNPSIIQSLVRHTKAKVIMIDPIAKELSLTKHSYIDFLDRLGQSYLACFDAKPLS